MSPYLVAFLIFASSIAAADIPCSSCHGSDRSKAYEVNPYGVSFFKKEQCFGCHEHVNEVSKRSHDNISYRNFPLPKSKLSEISMHPLSFEAAPLLGLKNPSSQPKYIATELIKFIRQPPTGKSTMPASSFANDVEIQKVISKNETISDEVPGDSRRGEMYFKRRCQSCHSLGIASTSISPLKFSIYASSYMKDRFKAHHNFSLSLTQAKNLRAFSIKMRNSLSKKLEKIFDNLIVSSPKDLPKKDFSATAFLKKHHCVHCHDAGVNPGTSFIATPVGLQNYLQDSSRRALFMKRLRIRRHEIRLGLTNSTAGMPSTKAAVPEEEIAQLEHWSK